MSVPPWEIVSSSDSGVSPPINIINVLISPLNQTPVLIQILILISIALIITGVLRVKIVNSGKK